MSVRHKDLFRQLDPPPGGMVRLRERLDRRQAPRLGWRLAFVGAVSSLALFTGVYLWAPTAPPDVFDLSAHPAFVNMGLAPELEERVMFRTGTSDMQAAPMLLDGEEVRYYLVASQRLAD